MRAALSEAVERTLKDMKPAHYEYLSDFARKAFAEGRAEGQAEGSAGLLLKLLQLKFGQLPESVVGRVQSAEIEELDRWGERVLSAQSLEDILG